MVNLTKTNIQQVPFRVCGPIGELHLIDGLDILFEGFRLEFMPIENAYDHKHNNSWNGMLGAIHRSKCDFIAEGYHFGAAILKLQQKQLFLN